MQQLGEEEEEQGGSGILDDSAETIYDDMRFVVERHKREQDFKKRQNRLKAIKREQLLQLENVGIKELFMARSFVNLHDVQLSHREKNNKRKNIHNNYGRKPSLK